MGAQGVTAPALKAAFLYNFANFAEWPADALAPGQRLSLCVVGDNAVADALEQTIKGRVIDDHELMVEVIKPDGPIRVVSICCTSAGLDGKPAGALLDSLKDTPIFTVSDVDSFAELGGVAQLILENGRMRFAVNVGAAHARGPQDQLEAAQPRNGSSRTNTMSSVKQWFRNLLDRAQADRDRCRDQYRLARRRLRRSSWPTTSRARASGSAATPVCSPTSSAPTAPRRWPSATPAAPSETLGAVAVNGHIMSAAIFSLDGTLFAHYDRASGSRLVCACPQSTRTSATSRPWQAFGGGTLLVARPIRSTAISSARSSSPPTSTEVARAAIRFVRIMALVLVGAALAIALASLASAARDLGAAAAA